MPAILTLTLLALTTGAPEATEGVEVSLEGKIREVSSKGRTVAMLETTDGRGLSLTSPVEGLGEELRRLSGVLVRLKGRRSSAKAPDGEPVSALSYEILDVGGGVVPKIGTIAAMDIAGQRRLIFVDESGSAELLPAAWVKRMGGHVGAKVWMVGRVEQGELRPSRFSILRPGPKPPEADQKR